MVRSVGVVITCAALLLAGGPGTGVAQGKGGGKGQAAAHAGGSGAKAGAQQGRGQTRARPSQGGGQQKQAARPRQGGGQQKQAARPRQGGGQQKQQPARSSPAGGQGKASARPGGQQKQASAKAAAGERGNGVGAKRGGSPANGRGAAAARPASTGRTTPAVSADARSFRLARQELTRLPQPIRSLQASGRRNGRMVAGAVALAAVHGLRPDAVDVRGEGSRIEVWNRRGEVLFDLDEGRARNLGTWNLRLLGDRQPTEDAPAFCRSGAGHPVWGREWCLDRSYGLGRSNDRLWSRTTGVSDIIFRRPSTLYAYRYDRPSLLELLGDVVLSRLALHALSLGFDQPLAGRWVAEPQAPRLLLIDAGPEPVAELVDLDGDNRVDVLYVTHYAW